MISSNDEVRFSRQLPWFGQDGQSRIAAARVSIVGLGGLGSHVAQALAYLGVGSIVLVDDDVVDESSLNRLIGAIHADINKPKVEVARRLIELINPKATIEPLCTNLRSNVALKALIDCPIVFGCVDTYGARLILSELTAAYSNTLLDCATDLAPDGGRDPGGRVVVTVPGEYCLTCAGQMSTEQAKQDLETPETRELRIRHNYGLTGGEPAASVVSVNGVIANLAVTEFAVMTAQKREPTRQLTYKLSDGRVTSRSATTNSKCYTCNGIAGCRERANIFRYALDKT